MDYQSETIKLLRRAGLRLVRSHKRSDIFHSLNGVKVKFPKRSDGSIHVYNKVLKSAGILTRLKIG